MPSYFCLTVRFLQPYSHGRGESGDPEWPPSPMRVYQALVAAAAARWNERMRLEYAVPALEWLEEQRCPTIVAAVGVVSGVRCQFYVPDNTADLVVPAWSRGDVNKAVKRTEKIVRPTHLRGGDAVHYLFPLPDGACPHLEVLAAAARSITHLGWGIDMVAGNATIISDDDAANLPGVRWQPVADANAKGYRVPVQGTLDALIKKHEAFLNRLGPNGFNPVPPLSAFRVVGYRTETDPQPRLFEAFSILKPDAEGFRPYDPVRRTHIVAGMVRHAACLAAKAAGWKTERINTLVHGHTPDGSQKGRSENGMPRLAYVPLPTIGTKGGGRFNVVGSIRRVLIVGSGITATDLGWVRRALSGQELTDEDSHQPVALLTLLPKTDHHVRRYTDSRPVWDTVCPVVLPGHDDRDANKTEKLLRQAIRQAGFSETLAKFATLEWRRVGFRPGVDLAQRYVTSAHLMMYPRYHVRIEWRDGTGRAVDVRGPIVIGGGRFCGFGLFAPSE